MRLAASARQELSEVVMGMLQAKGRALSVRPGHVCSNHECNPENELALVRRGRLAPHQSHGTVDVYVCDHGGVHVCTPQDCQFKEICPISGCRYGNGVSYYTKGKPFGIDHYAKRWERTGAVSQGLSLRQKKQAAPKSGPAKRLGKGNLFKSADSAQPQPVATKRKWELTVEQPAQEAPAKKKKVRRVNTKKSIARARAKLRDRTRLLVMRLLFNDPIRREINEKRLRAADECWTRELRRYQEERKEANQCECDAWLKIIYLNTKGRTRLLPFLKHDEATLNYYVNIVLFIWDLVIQWGRPGSKNAGNTLCTNLTIGVLYAMQRGLVVSDCAVLPRDPFLVEALPPIKELDKYEMAHGDKNFRQACMQGEKLISQTAMAALQGGASMESVSFVPPSV